MPPSPLSKAEKQKFVTLLAKFDDDQKLAQALFLAVCEGRRLPETIAASLSAYQALYFQEENSAVKAHLKSAIDQKIKDDILLAFKQMCQDYQLENDWPTEFISCLSRELKIPLQASRTVQVAIQEGKVYWRVMEGKTVRYDRQKAKKAPPFKFTADNSFEMTWEQFREYKDMGKRHGTVAVTLERFKAAFPEEKQDQAEAVWNELKTQDILDKKNRLSEIWRLLSNVDITLNSLSDPLYFIDKEKLISLLKTLRGEGRYSKQITKAAFIEKCQRKFPGMSDKRLEALWNTLRKNGVLKEISENKYTITLVFSEKILAVLHLSYTDIAQALHAIMNNPAYKETITETDDDIFRPELSQKTWVNETVKNDLTAESRTRLWDVARYIDLENHRRSAAERKEHGEILNYDHIPSGATLRDFIATELKPLREELKKLHEEIKNLSEKIDLLEAETQKKLTKKEQEKKFQEKKILEDELTTLKDALKKKENELKDKEKSFGDEDTWFTLAIPEKLHSQGVTYLKSSTSQKTKVQAFIDEFKAYVSLLSTRPADFGFEGKHALFCFVAAFRHLYRCQMKMPLKYSFRMGKAPYLFFKQKKLHEKVDTLLLQETRNALACVS